MFRVAGQDARGRRREISVNAATPEEARAIVLRSGELAVVEEVAAPPPSLSGQPVRLSGCTLTVIGSLNCLVSTAIGTVIGGLLGHEADASSSEFLKSKWLLGGFVGAIPGVICGVNLLVAVVKRFSNPR
jgi:hypothetical protein